jgi:ATP-dependent protease ClpP protease subunit
MTTRVKTEEYSMTSKIDITGIIGIDTTYESVIQKLDESRKDIEIVINSVGGFVYDGIAIHNALKKYDKGTKTIRVIGISASIASYIMLAGDKLELEENSVVMIHNPSIVAIGDYRKLRNAYQHIEKLRQIMSLAYSKYTGIGKADIEAMMDNETYFIGANELKTWGNVIEDNSVDNKTNKQKITKEEAELQIKATQSIIEKDAPNRNREMEQLVALLEDFEPINFNKKEKEEKEEIEKNTLNFTNNHKKAMENKNIETLQDLKIQYPKLYAEAINIGIQEEKSRVKAHLEFIDVAQDTAINSIKEDIPFLNNSEIQAKYLRARINKSEILAMEKDNNEEIIPKKIDENEELKKEKEEKTERENKEAEEKIRNFMPHLSNNTKE